MFYEVVHNESTTSFSFFLTRHGLCYALGLNYYCFVKNMLRCRKRILKKGRKIVTQAIHN
jgi:hypothetical protein